MAGLSYNSTSLHARAPFHSPKPIPSKYAVVIDAGSSGSRIQVFSWKDPAVLQSQLLNSASSSTSNSTILNSVPEITQDAKFNKKITPGISSYAGKARNLWKSHFKPLIKHAESGVPKSERPNTPLFVLATAGMRLLPEAEQQAILTETCKILREKTTFYIPECETHVSIIDGETEALYGWLSLNYLLQTFNSIESNSNNNYNNIGSGKTQGTEKSDALLSPVTPNLYHHNHQSYGFMDMGGASMQVAFAPNSTETERHLNDLYTVRLRSLSGENQEWRLFVSSWLGFGANEARKRYAQHLLEVEGYYDTTKTANVQSLPQDPCFPAGLAHEMKVDSNTTMSFQGAGNFTTCLESMQPLLRKDQPCEEDPCLFNGIHAPAIDFKSDRFVGVSEYWYTANNIFKLGGHYDFPTFSKHVAEYCSRPWNEMQKEMSRGGIFEGIHEENLKAACFKATWVINVLHSGFKLPIDEFGKVLEIESSPSAFKPRVQPVASGSLTAKFQDTNSTAHFNKRDLDDFLSPFQSALSIENTELTWMLGRALLYASSQVPPTTSSTSDVGFLPADAATKHYVLGGELDGKVPGLNSNIENQSSSSYGRPQSSSFSDSFMMFLGSVAIFALAGYALMYMVYAFKHKRLSAWSTLKLRVSSIPMTFSRSAASLRRTVFGEHGSSGRKLGGSRLNWNSGGYQRVLEEGGFTESSHSLDSFNGSSTNLNANLTNTSTTANSMMKTATNISTPEFRPDNSFLSPQPLRGKFNGKDGSHLMSVSTTALNRVFSDKMNPLGFNNNFNTNLNNSNINSTTTETIHETNNEIPISSTLKSGFSNNNNNNNSNMNSHINGNKLFAPSLLSGMGQGRSTSMIDLSVYQNPTVRPPSRPSSRMSLFNNNSNNLINHSNTNTNSNTANSNANNNNNNKSNVNMNI